MTCLLALLATPLLVPLEVGRLPPGLWADAGINRRALSEPSELARPPSRRVRPI
jgi:hypothetical protein